MKIFNHFQSQKYQLHNERIWNNSDFKHASAYAVGWSASTNSSGTVPRMFKNGVWKGGTLEYEKKPSDVFWSRGSNRIDVVEKLDE